MDVLGSYNGGTRFSSIARKELLLHVTYASMKLYLRERAYGGQLRRPDCPSNPDPSFDYYLLSWRPQYVTSPADKRQNNLPQTNFICWDWFPSNSSRVLRLSVFRTTGKGWIDSSMKESRGMAQVRAS